MKIPFNAIAVAVLVLVVLVVAWSLFRRDKMALSRINLEDLMMGPDGKMSKAAAVMFGSFVVTTWMMVFLTLTGKMSEGYFTIYGGLWIAPTVAWIIKGNPPPTDPSTPPAPT